MSTNTALYYPWFSSLVGLISVGFIVFGGAGCSTSRQRPQVHRVAHLHIVEPGETLSSIARRYNTSVELLVASNAIKDPDRIRVGQSLVIPSAKGPSSIVRVASGDAEPRKPQIGTTVSRGDVPQSALGSTTRGPREKKSEPRPAQRSQDIDTENAPMALPLKQGVVLRRFGRRREKGGRTNDSITIAAPAGASVLAADDGIVVVVRQESGPMQYVIILRHFKESQMSVYLQMSEALVKEGERVQRGQPIGRIRANAYVETPRIEFQVREGRRAVDPMTLLRAPKPAKKDQEEST